MLLAIRGHIGEAAYPWGLDDKNKLRLYMDIKETDILGDSIDDHWYYQSKWLAVKAMLPAIKRRLVWDIGGGSGFFSKALINAGMTEQAVSIDTGYTENSTENLEGGTLHFQKSKPQGNPDLIIFMDVLEHVDDDVGLITEYASHLDEDGIILITVPAFKLLWSDHDDFLEHKRRYSRALLEQTIEKANFDILELRFFYGLLFPIAAPIRIMRRHLSSARKRPAHSHLTQHSKLVNYILKAIHSFERKVVFPWNGWFGISIICTAKPRK